MNSKFPFKWRHFALTSFCGSAGTAFIRSATAICGGDDVRAGSEGLTMVRIPLGFRGNAPALDGAKSRLETYQRFVRRNLHQGEGEDRYLYRAVDSDG